MQVKKEIKEVVTKKEYVTYVATDGTVFWDEDECRKYEESAKCLVRTNMKRTIIGACAECELFEAAGYGSDEYTYFICKVETQADRDVINQALIFDKVKDECLLASDFVGEVLVGCDYENNLCYTTTLTEVFNAVQAAYDRIKADYVKLAEVL